MMLLYHICLESMEHDVDSYQAAIAREVFGQKKRILQFNERQFFSQCFCSKATFQRYLKKLNMESFEMFKRTVFKEMEEIEARMKQHPKNQLLQKRLLKAKQVSILAEYEARFLLEAYLPYFLYINPCTRLFLPLDQNLNSVSQEDLLIVASTEHMLLDMVIFLSFEFGQNLNFTGTFRPTVFIGPKGIFSKADPPISLYIDSAALPSQRISSFCKAVESILF